MPGLSSSRSALDGTTRELLEDPAVRACVVCESCGEHLRLDESGRLVRARR